MEQIADAATAIADHDGLDAVTMQVVAERLGAAKMALYRYLPGRAELEAVMLDRALGAPDTFGDGEWASALTRWATALYERASQRPWTVELIQRPHLPGPNELGWYEAGLAALQELNLDGREKLDVLAMLAGHVVSIVRQQAAGPAPEEDLAKALAPVLMRNAHAFPLTVAAFSQPSGSEHDDALHFGLARMVAGIEALATARAHPQRRR
ncbi:TetR/AcrR family transcriptional regulator C-terminal domain-containing protein [Actinospica robiniae]|uniref:Transcriptional regulator, tetR family n=1 Tax=Actinospica robiniae DSM 44927 TaxID=479430 RepID=W9E511_9ACTN|nr:TetR/AcrR family transcriptional regulator C-terminal domain-containing protein [Actinospica robiniae]ETA71106.1 transcriptional regulator, tetR family [Actinospica robiniae DSM 44927]